MAARRTRVTISIPWDDEDTDHPSGWDYDELMDLATDDNGIGTILVDFVDIPITAQPV